MKLTESLDNVADYTKNGKHPNFTYEFSLRPELDTDIFCFIDHFQMRPGDGIDIRFDTRDRDVEAEKGNKSTFKIFATISEIVQSHIREYPIIQIKCSAYSEARYNIYAKLFKRLGSEWEIKQNRPELTATKRDFI